jgi:hypothetical protein
MFKYFLTSPCICVCWQFFFLIGCVRTSFVQCLSLLGNSHPSNEKWWMVMVL